MRWTARAPGGHCLLMTDFGTMRVPDCASAEFLKVRLTKRGRPSLNHAAGRQWRRYEEACSDRAREAYCQGDEVPPPALTWAEFTK